MADRRRTLTVVMAEDIEKEDWLYVAMPGSVTPEQAHCSTSFQVVWGVDRLDDGSVVIGAGRLEAFKFSPTELVCVWRYS